MLYVLIACANGLCMPADTLGVGKLTLPQCQERVVEMRRLTHAVHFDCYLSEDDGDDDADWLSDAVVLRQVDIKKGPSPYNGARLGTFGFRPRQTFGPRRAEDRF